MRTGNRLKAFLLFLVSSSALSSFEIQYLEKISTQAKPEEVLSEVSHGASTQVKKKIYSGTRQSYQEQELGYDPATCYEPP